MTTDGDDPGDEAEAEELRGIIERASNALPDPRTEKLLGHLIRATERPDHAEVLVTVSGALARIREILADACGGPGETGSVSRPEDRDEAAQLCGFFKGLAGTGRYDFDSFERARFRRASNMLARMIGRPDLITDEESVPVWLQAARDLPPPTFD